MMLVAVLLNGLVCTIGIACVSNCGEHARETIEHAVAFVVEGYPDIEVLGVRMEVIPVD